MEGFDVGHPIIPVQICAADIRLWRTTPAKPQATRLPLQWIACAPSASQQPSHPPHDENQCSERDNSEREKVAFGIGENVIRMSRIEAIELFKGSRQRR